MSLLKKQALLFLLRPITIINDETIYVPFSVKPLWTMGFELIDQAVLMPENMANCIAPPASGMKNILCLSFFHILDLTIIRDGSGFRTKSFFKKTNRNRYIPLYSFHHPSWLPGIPKSQFLRIQCNCFNMNAFMNQLTVI